ncbi:MAG: hypothetical protein BJ554DRAFT_662 [Olpidium bornovanus]|uniref:Uncharacterized protein n=1 Tax=Olpidium bornovanus TaxID=278681 RepID=A0A8H7ZSX7_9FUNG|nr:MAG: hypothetical protein BJ554DRAFT_662 [Olpidium bornovanus]
MEELVRSFDITGGDRRPAPDLPTRRPRRASPRPVRFPHISRAGAGAPEVPKAPAARRAEQTRASPELDGTTAELARVMAKTASLQSEMDCVVADYCAAMDLMRDLKEYGEEKRRLADLAQSRAHEHACNQLRNAHHKTLTTVRSGLAAHITSLEAELQKAGARIRGLEAAVAASAAFRASSPSPSFTSSFSNSAQHPHRRSQFAGQVAASVSGPASAAAPTQRHHGAVAGSAGSMGEATTLFEEIAKEFESRVPKF